MKEKGKSQRPPLAQDQQLDLLCRGTVEVIRREELREKLQRSAAAHKPLTVKAGFDPTAPDLHLGHAVLLQKLRAFQDLGHEVTFLIGDFTGMIGDPSGVSETRRPLSRQEVLDNARTYERQVFLILDRKKTTIAFNSRWMSRMTAEDLLRLSSQYNVARIFERDDFQKRYREGKPIGLHEFLYPLIQGHDSVVLKADVELGGTDQTFNLLVGRELQRASGLEPQVVMTMPLLEGLDGVRKMSKSFGNAIAFDDPPQEMFGKIMSLSDVLMMKYYELLTTSDLLEIQQLHPMDAKMALATELITRFHSGKAAQQARSGFEKTFRQREFPQDADATFRVAAKSFPLVGLLSHTHLVKSRGEAKRLIMQGAVDIDGKTQTDPQSLVTIEKEKRYHLKIGKRRFAVVIGE